MSRQIHVLSMISSTAADVKVT